MPDARRLCRAALPRLHPAVMRPSYDPARHGCGIVHIGVGAFHRVHQAVYTDTALGSHGGDWRINGISLRSNLAATQLCPQDGLYTVLSKSEQSRAYRLIGAINSIIASNGNWGTKESIVAVEELARPQTSIVSLTITEKGYSRDMATGRLDSDNAGVVADLENPRTPGTATGCLVEALRLRRERGLGPFTILSCDNLSANGQAVKQVVVDYAAMVDSGLSQWIERNTAFPSTMVDRICPATTEQDRLDAEVALGLEDHGLVVTEPFSQWVIEDQFNAGRPRWEEAGAIFVGNVTLWESAKLRLLNGSHSAIAYLGALEEIEFVHVAVQKPDFTAFLDGLMDEIESTLQTPSEFDVSDYRTTVLARFQNSALPYANLQVASDGSLKLPQRLIAPALERLASGRPVGHLALAIAAWIRFVTSEDSTGQRRQIDDPLACELTKLPSSSSHGAGAVVDAALGLSQVFGAECSSNAAFREGIVVALESIVRFGAAGALAGSRQS